MFASRRRLPMVLVASCILALLVAIDSHRATAADNVLFNQIGQSAGGRGVSSDCGGELADDFRVPATTTWVIQHVVFVGNTDQLPTTITIHIDDHGVPGTDVYRARDLLPASVTPTSSSDFYEYLFELPSPATLGPGAYWIGFGYAGSGSLSWQVNTIPGAPGVKDNGCGQGWGDPRSPMNGQFRLLGTTSPGYRFTVFVQPISNTPSDRADTSRTLPLK